MSEREKAMGNGVKMKGFLESRGFWIKSAGQA